MPHVVGCCHYATSFHVKLKKRSAGGFQCFIFATDGGSIRTFALHAVFVMSDSGATIRPVNNQTQNPGGEAHA
jgi:hypothetical protein